MDKPQYNSESRLHDLFNAMEDVVFEMDYNGKYLNIAPTKLDLMVASKEELTGKNLHDIFPKDQADYFLDFIRKCLDQQKSDRIVYQLEINKRNIWFEGRATPIAEDRVLYIASDITEHFNAEKELEHNKELLLEALEKSEKNEKRYRLLFENMNSGCSIWRKEGDDFINIGYNQAGLEMDGFGHEEMFGIMLSQVVPDPVAKLQAFDLFERVLNTGKPEFLPRTKYEVKGREVVRSNFFYRLNEDEIVCIFDDLTLEVKAEEELIDAKERAIESDKLKTAFLQNISHEIRTPLNAICGFSKMLDKKQLDEKEKKSYVSLIQSNSDQLLSIISDVLAVSALETGQEMVKINDTHINAVLMELFAVFSARAKEKKVSFTLNKALQDQFSVIKTDETKVRQVLSNLLSNALKFTSSGSIDFGYRDKKGFLEFYIADSGIGIQQEHLNKIFARFNQADSTIQASYGGTGLGLSISKGYIEMLGGEIWVESEYGQGSTFYFTLPYKPVNQMDSKEEKDKNRFPILVADDESVNFLVLQGMLSDLPVDLIHAQNGREVIDIYKSNPSIQMILMDVKMPLISGVEAAKIIKEMNPKVHIIAQSGYSLEDDKEKFTEAFDDFLTKPIDDELLKEKINKFL